MGQLGVTPRTRMLPKANSRTESVIQNSATIRWGLRRVSLKYLDQKCECCWTVIKLSLVCTTNKYTRRFSNHESRLLSRAHTFAIIVILDLKIHQSMWIHWSFFPITWTKGHWPLDDLWPHVCWGHICDSTHGSLCPSPMTIHQCMWIQWSILQITTYIHTYTTCILRTYYVQNEGSHSLLLNSVQARQKPFIPETVLVHCGILKVRV